MASKRSTSPWTRLGTQIVDPKSPSPSAFARLSHVTNITCLALLLTHEFQNQEGLVCYQARILFYGAGSSAVGVANTIVRLLQKEGGLSEVKAKQACL